MSKIANIKSFEGQHCETTTAGVLLQHIGIDLSEMEKSAMMILEKIK